MPETFCTVSKKSELTAGNIKKNYSRAARLDSAMLFRRSWVKFIGLYERI